MKFSFIVPCYNVEKYIDRSLDSIEALKLPDYEIVVVNDGSTDQTITRLNRRAETNPNIVVISQLNQGASAARNNGLNHSNGDFVIFVDSDDQVLVGLSDVFEKIISDDQLVLFNVLQQFPEQNAEYRIHQENRESIDKSELIRKDLYINAPWGKVISREVLLRNNIFFDTNLKICEDLPWSVQLLNSCLTVKTVDRDGYLYHRARVGSTSNTVTQDKIDGMFEAIESACVFDNKSDSSEIGLSMVAYQYILTLGYIGKSYHLFKSKIKKFNYLLRYDLNHRVHLIRWFNHFIPKSLLCRLLNRYIR